MEPDIPSASPPKAVPDTTMLNHIVGLNIGGRRFQTTKETLLKDQNSYFSALFSGNFVLGTDSRGFIFLDRDGKYFRYILNFLRDGSLDPIDDVGIILQVRREAEFYRLEGLAQLLHQMEQAKRREVSDSEGEYALVYLGGYGNAASVYTKDTEGGFTNSCKILNELAESGHHVEGAFSGTNGQYYAIMRSKTSQTKSYGHKSKQRDRETRETRDTRERERDREVPAERARSPEARRARSPPNTPD